MTIDERIDDLEAGFRDLMTGVLALVKVLREENVTLQARLDERRQMAEAVQSSSVAGPMPPTTSTPPVTMVDTVAAASVPRRPRYPSTVRTCGICQQDFVGSGERMFCDACGRIRKRGGLRSGALAARAGERLKAVS